MDLLTDRFGYSFYFIRVYVFIDSSLRHKKHWQIFPLYIVVITIKFVFGFFCNSKDFFSPFVIRIFIILNASNIQICNDRNRHIEAFSILSPKYIDISFTFLGEQYTDGQALEWPRYGIVDSEGYTIIDDGTIPQKLIDATCYLASQAASGTLIPVDDGVRSETFGPVSKTYSGQKTFTMAEKLLRQLIVSGNTMVRVN